MATADWDPQSETFLEEDKRALSRIGFDVGSYIGKGFYGKVFGGVCNERASKLVEVNINFGGKGSAGMWSTGTRQMREESLNGRPFAIKWIKPLPRDNVLTEGKVLMSLNHPNVVEIFFVTKMQYKNNYVIMEYLNGQTLGDFLQTHQRNRSQISQPETKNMILDLLEGLKYLHSQYVIHKDISILNVMFHTMDETEPEPYRILKYVDFNLAQELSKAFPQEMFDSLSLDDIRLLGFTYDAIKRYTQFTDTVFEQEVNGIVIRMKTTSFPSISEVYTAITNSLAKTDHRASFSSSHSS